MIYVIVMQVVFILNSSERCCYLRLSQYCHWSSPFSKLLQVGLVHCMNTVATALLQKKQLHTLSKIYAALLIKYPTPKFLSFRVVAHLELSGQRLQVIVISQFFKVWSPWAKIVLLQ